MKENCVWIWKWHIVPHFPLILRNCVTYSKTVMLPPEFVHRAILKVPTFWLGSWNQITKSVKVVSAFVFLFLSYFPFFIFMRPIVMQCDNKKKSLGARAFGFNSLEWRKKIFYYFFCFCALVSRHYASFSSTTQHAIPWQFGVKFGEERSVLTLGFLASGTNITNVRYFNILYIKFTKWYFLQWFLFLKYIKY